MSTTSPAIPDKELEDDDILLTDAERAGMQEEDEGDGDGAGGEGTDGQKAGEEPKAGDPPADTPADGTGGEPGPDDDFKPTSVPPLRTTDTAAATARIAEIEAERDRLAQEFDDGEMTAAEYRQANAKLESEQRDLDWTLRKADLSQELTAQQQEAAWYSEVGTFLNENKDVLKPDSLVLQAFDIAVRQVTGDEANDALNNRQKLQKAYDRLRADMGLAPVKASASAAPQPRDTGKPTMRDLPPNLKNVPAADLESTDDGQFAMLDRLMETDPMGYEAALAKMPEAQQDAYLRSR